MSAETKMLTDEQIDVAQEAAYRALVEKGYNGGMGGYQWDRASARAIEAAVLASPEVQGMRRDTLLSVLGKLNCNPYSLTKPECIDLVVKMFEEAEAAMEKKP